MGVNGNGKITYQTALTAVFVEGIIFIVLALTGMRQWLVKLIPSTLKTATGVGIGLLLTEIGLSYSAGIGAITGGGNATPLALGGCPAELISPATGLCESGQMTNPKVRSNLDPPASTSMAQLVYVSLDVACHLLRRHHDRFSHGLSCQIFSRDRNRLGVSYFMAVSFFPSPLVA